LSAFRNEALGGLFRKNSAASLCNSTGIFFFFLHTERPSTITFARLTRFIGGNPTPQRAEPDCKKRRQPASTRPECARNGWPASGSANGGEMGRRRGKAVPHTLSIGYAAVCRAAATLSDATGIDAIHRRTPPAAARSSGGCRMDLRIVDVTYIAGWRSAARRSTSKSL
jgi:hypothetical protein